MLALQKAGMTTEQARSVINSPRMAKAMVDAIKASPPAESATSVPINQGTSHGGMSCSYLW